MAAYKVYEMLVGDEIHMLCSIDCAEAFLARVGINMRPGIIPTVLYHPEVCEICSNVVNA
jgi:hypothetical protein